jgi:MipA family protein
MDSFRTDKLPHHFITEETNHVSAIVNEECGGPEVRRITHIAKPKMIAKMKTWTLVCNITAGLVLASAGALAQGAPASSENKPYGFSVGVGAWTMRSPIAGDKSAEDGGLFPYIAYQNDWFAIDPSQAALRLAANENFAFHVLAAPRWLLFNPKDSTLHADIKRKTSFDVGARFSAMTGPAVASIEYRGDVTGRINGHEAIGAVSAELDLPGSGTLGVKGGARWRDRNLNTYLYGVRRNEARATRPAYIIQDGLTPFAGLSISYPLIDKLTVTVAFETEYLSKKITLSPIIARKTVPSAFIGVFYSF